MRRNVFQRMRQVIRRTRRRGVRVRVVRPRVIQVVKLVVVVLVLAGLQDLRARGFGHPVRSARLSSSPGSALLPFTREKAVRFELLGAQTVELQVENLMGLPVRTYPAVMMPAGEHELVWDGCRDDGREVAAGFYSLEVVFGGVREQRKVAWIGP
jgi:hypothetical protein